MSVVAVCVWRVCVWRVQLVPAYFAAGLKKDAMEAIPFVDRPTRSARDIYLKVNIFTWNLLKDTHYGQGRS